MQYLARAAVMGWCLRSGFLPPAPTYRCDFEAVVPLNLGVLKICDCCAAAAITTPPRMEVLQPTPHYDFKGTYTLKRLELPRTREPPRSGGGSNYIPRAGSNSNFCQHPTTTSKGCIPSNDGIEPPRSGGGSNYTTYRNPASRLKFEFLPPEANTPLRLKSNISP
ncbi:hypothetical protein C8R43DRAFT_1119693 [Mycena crocata]|nr:hypothetical protein C8R43DRAFT_1119693 [Mycena crocata]